jgi:AraC-like DNA-binding protein
MLDYYQTILSQPNYFRQFRCGESLISMYNCPLENRFVDLWSKYNYVTYIVDGRKIWHTAHGSYDLRKGDCFFVRKGACIVEQFFDTPFCLMVFFVPDEFICETLRSKTALINIFKKKYEPVFKIDATSRTGNFFHAMSAYFAEQVEPDPLLLEVKFRELILILADNPKNAELLSLFCAMMHEPQAVALQRVMEDNFRYNLKLEQFAALSNRSLSAFKRDFLRQFQTSPGKWLLEKRLQFARHLLSHSAKTISEVAFESGFENPSHFSRSFKESFGMSPTQTKRKKSSLNF